MSGLDESVRDITDALDSVGNTTAAMGKGFAIGSAALTALALFVSYAQAVNLTTINVLQPTVIIGLLVGGMLPFLFSAFTMESVSKAAYKMIEEVRRQFRTCLLYTSFAAGICPFLFFIIPHFFLQRQKVPRQPRGEDTSLPIRSILLAGLLRCV